MRSGYRPRVNRGTELRAPNGAAEPDEIIDAHEAARRIGTTAACLNTWRCTGRIKIPFIRIGRSIRYRASSIQEFLQKHTVTQ